MVITPNDNDFQTIVKANEEIGSSEGGDQGILNRGLCPNWFHANNDDCHCGRLPWIYNVGAAYYDKYKTYQIMSKLPTPLVVHFVSEGKPWAVLSFEYYQGNLKQVMNVDVFRDLGRQAEVHLIWREKFFRQTGQAPSPNKLLLAAATGQPLPSKLSEIVITAPNKKSKQKKHSNINRKDSDNTKSSLIRKRRDKAKKAEKTTIPKEIESKTKTAIPKGKKKINTRKKRTDL
jgi:lipopolysaccharide biosynthesis glycosyltransferase